MESFYLTYSRENLSLDNITEEQKELLKEIYQSYQTNPDLPDFADIALSQDSFERMGAPKIVNERFYLNQRLSNTTVYKVVRDLVSTLEMQQGYSIEDPFDEPRVRNNKKTLEEFLKDE